MNTITNDIDENTLIMVTNDANFRDAAEADLSQRPTLQFGL